MICYLCMLDADELDFIPPPKPAEIYQRPALHVHRAFTLAHGLVPRGRKGVSFPGFQGRRFESHRRRILTVTFSASAGSLVSKIFAIEIMKAALQCSAVQSSAHACQHLRLQISRSGVRFPPVALLIFFCCSYLLFAFCREVAHLTWSRSFDFTTFFTIWFSPMRKNASTTKFLQVEYELKWKDADGLSWEEESNCSCQTLIREFDARLRE